VNKPPLTYWAVAVSYKIFGINEFAVRLPGALAALGVMLFSWGAAYGLYGPRAALFAAAVAATTPRVFILERRLPIDILLLFFLTGTLFFFLRAAQRSDSPAQAINQRFPGNNASAWRLAYVFMALGFMTKGPIAVIIPAGALIAWMFCAKKLRLSDIRLFDGAAIFLCITLPWYILSYLAHGWEYIAPFFLSDNLGRFASESFGPSRGFFYYIPIWFSDFFPWSLIGPAAFLFLTSRREFRDRLKDASFGLPFFWCALVFIIFSLSKNKQEYYIAPMYPAAAVIIAGFLAGLSRMDRPGAPGGFRLWRWIYGILAFLLLSLAFILPVILDLLMPGISVALRLAPSLILFAGAGLTGWNAFRKNFHGAFASLAFSIWIILFSGALIYVPALENFRPVKDFCAAIENAILADAGKNGETEAGYFRTSVPSMAFYLKRRIFEEDNYDRMLLRFQSGDRVFCIVDSRDYDWFVKQRNQSNQNNKDTRLYILDRREHFSIRFGHLFNDEKRAGHELLLVSNRP
jgi:4-amino-4-deoxy-L-arabinose transferase-like glycosyltransferase